MSEYERKHKRKKRLILFTQLSIFILFITVWELLAKHGMINTFITSSPSNIIKTIINLYNTNNLFNHIWVTLYETILAFTLTLIISILISIILYKSDFLAKVIDPYLTLLNSLPKVALGPILIIWIGANEKSIITMGILITIIVSIQSIYNGFKNTPPIKIKLMKTFNASNKDIFLKLVFPQNIRTIVNTLKINTALCLVGIIMGEFLTSKAGIGYLILYGSQVFNSDLVMAGIFILIILSILIYKIITYIEKRLEKY